MIVGFSGKIGSGKDTSADLLIKFMQTDSSGHNFGHWENRKFATILKMVSSVLTGMPLEDMHSQEGKLKMIPDLGMTVRQFQQRFATEAVRERVHQDLWVIAAMRGYNPLKDNWVFSDVRFLNEAVAIKNRGGILVRLIGNPKNLPRDENHPSETDLDNFDFDYTIINNGDMDNLTTKILSLSIILKLHLLGE